MTHILPLKKGENKIIDESIDTLQKGGLIVFPSDTVYGLLVDATNETAVSKLIAFKNRPPGKPISVFVAGMAMLRDYASFQKREEQLLNSLLPGPFTVLLNSKQKVSSRLESEKKILGLRIPDYPLVTELVSRFGGPLTATSANISGRKPHYRIDPFLQELSSQKKELIDLVVDAGNLPRNKPSTIIDLTQDSIRMLRKGDIQFKNSETFLSESAGQTQKIAEFLLKKNKKKVIDKPLVFILKGDVGAGKTVFAKGVGITLGLTDIISPTYVIYYEYKVPSGPVHTMYHYDLYNIMHADEFNHLGIEKYLKPGSVFVFEWGEKTGPVFEKLKQSAHIIDIDIAYINEHEREIKVNQ